MKKEILISTLTSRFLFWGLPSDFNPDGCISFRPTSEMIRVGRAAFAWPIGANLMDAQQASEMFKELLDGIDLYGPPPPYQKRVIDEYEELQTKLAALLRFMDTEDFGLVFPAEQKRMLYQAELMTQYCDVLRERISNF